MVIWTLCSIRLISPSVPSTILSYLPIYLQLSGEFYLLHKNDVCVISFSFFLRRLFGAMRGPRIETMLKHTAIETPEMMKEREKTFMEETNFKEKKDVNSSYHCNFYASEKLRSNLRWFVEKRRKKHNINNNLAFLPTWQFTFCFFFL